MALTLNGQAHLSQAHLTVSPFLRYHILEQQLMDVPGFRVPPGRPCTNFDREEDPNMWPKLVIKALCDQHVTDLSEPCYVARQGDIGLLDWDFQNVSENPHYPAVLWDGDPSRQCQRVSFFDILLVGIEFKEVRIICQLHR
jgi:hypothetical protein